VREGSKRRRGQAPDDRLLPRRDEQRREIITPEGVPLSLALAERGDRAAAFLMDAFFIAGGLLVLVLLAVFASRGRLEAGSWTTSFALLAVFALRNFYFIAFEMRWRGQTPGKRALKIRVIDRHGGALTADMVVARNLLREIEVFLPLGVLVAGQELWPGAPTWARLVASLWVLVLGLVPFFNRDRLRIGDLVAGTMVVRSPAVFLMPDIGGLVAEQARRAETRYQFTPAQLEVYGIYELQVLENVLRDEKTGAARQDAIDLVCDKIKTKIEWDREHWAVDAERFLREFYAALRAQLERKMLFGKRQEDKFSIKK
jgi:uncharacterized RDD family membrane protein YckC